jgi:hypothetical protein
MTSEEKSFERLLEEAPAAPAGGVISLVGTLAKSSEPGKFLLTLQDGSFVTLETEAVKGHMVLGSSVGQTIVRVDVAAGSLPVRDQQMLRFNSVPAWESTFAIADAPGLKFWLDVNWKAIMDVSPAHAPFVLPAPDLGLEPFALATPHQAPASAIAAMQGFANAFAIPPGGGDPYGASRGGVHTGWHDNKLRADSASPFFRPF